MPNDIITSNKVNITPLVNELVEYVKDKKAIGDIEEMISSVPAKSSPDWGKELIQHIQSDIGYLIKRLGLVE